MAQVFLQHSRMLEGLLRRMVGPTADAEDLLQETFLQAIRSFPSFRGEASVKTWLYRIAIHVAHHHIRRPDRRRTVSLTVIPGGENRDNAMPTDRVLAQREHATLLYHHLEALNPNQRIAFLLHVVEDKSMVEIAHLMDASVSATKSRVFWARKKLLGRAKRDPALRDLLGSSQK